MSSTPPANAAPQIEGEMFLFRKPELVTREQHGSLGITRPEKPMSFAATARAVPLVLSEVTAAMRHFPIIFSSTENPVPLAVLGLVDDINLFVDDNGEWMQDTYVPGYIRRYPFALASEKGTDTQNPRMAIIFDAGYEGVTSTPDIPFFQDGKPSSAMQQAMDFCQTYEQDRMMTQRFAEALSKYDLLASQMAQYTPEGQSAQPFARYVGVEESRLRDLSDDKFLELRKANILPILYAQLMSMGNWRTLLDRRARRFKLTGESVLKPLPKS
ncbi:MAG: SapC family protein [Parvularcula sp.]|jgi:hypothetical protein|nr:SapC family protein [Parvularcula sp.]